MEKRSEQTANWFPVVKYKVFFYTMVVAIIAMLFLSLPSSQIQRCGIKGSALDRFTYFVDPVFAHLLGVAAVGILMWFGASPMSEKKWKRLFICVSVPILTLLVIYMFGKFILKPSFAYDRPAKHLQTPWLSAILRADEPGKGDSCPSGFVVRQMFLFMIGLTFYRGFQVKRVAAEKGNWIEYVALIALIGAVIFAAFSRVYRGFHTMYDVGISISVSCYLFWLFYYFFGVSLARLPRNITSGIVTASCIFVPTFLYYSQDAHWWAIIGIVAFSSIGLSRALVGNYN